MDEFKEEDSIYVVLDFLESLDIKAASYLEVDASDVDKFCIRFNIRHR